MEWNYIDVSGQQIAFDEAQLGDLVKGGIIQAETLLWNETLSDWQQAGELFPAWFPQSFPELPPVASFEDIPAVPASDIHSTAAEAPEPEPAPAPVVTRASESAPVVTRASEPAPRELAAPRIKSQTHRTPAASGAKVRETVKDFASYLSANAVWMKLVGVISIVGGALICLTLVGIVVGWLPIWLGVLLFKGASCAQTAEVTGREEDLGESLYRIAMYFKIQGILMIAVIVLHAVAAIYLVASGRLPDFVKVAPSKVEAIEPVPEERASNGTME